MNLIKGFALNRRFINNTPNVVSGIGELSNLGFTFTKEPRVYSSQTFPTISLVHFPSKGSDVGTSAVIPDAQVQHILKVIDKVYQKSDSSTLFISPGEFLQFLLTEMPAEITTVTIGGSVTMGNRSIIEWVQWSNIAALPGNVNKVWFTNSAFEGQYDEYEITVIPPFLPLNQFFGQAAAVKALLNGRSYSVEMETINTARGISPESVLWGNTYNYVNPLNNADRTPAKFACLIYGLAGNNDDVLKQAIIDYLLANSDHTRDEWKQILPELFQRKEFLVYPQWTNIAIENTDGGANAVYSPVIDAIAVVEKMVVDSFEYAPDHVRNYGQTMAFPYMSVALGTIGHIENLNGWAKITQVYPDYFFTSTSSLDFDRMSRKTQDWVILMQGMLRVARDLTPSSTIPVGYSRVTRGNKLFVSKSYDSVQYLVASPAAPL